MTDLTDELRTYKGIPWARISVKKAAICVKCGTEIQPGEEAFRPLREGNGVVRNHRICDECPDSNPEE